MAAANWAKRRASEGSEREIMSQMVESGAFVASMAESDRRARAEPGGGVTVRESSSYRDYSGERRSRNGHGTVIPSEDWK